MKFPQLIKSSRDGEYNSYSIVTRAEVVYRYLFEGISHRKIDKIAIGLIPDESRGWQAMGILHYIGLVKDHKGIFSGLKILDAINSLKEEQNNEYDLLIKHLEVYSNKLVDIKELEEELRNNISKSSQDSKVNRLKRLELLKNNIPRQVNSISKVFIRNADIIIEVLERANGVCERCLKPAPFIRASDNTPYLEVHHKIPLASGGLDDIDNTIALCPNCHRELHFGK